MANYYWVGGAGTWNTTTTTNWASSTGGAGGAGVPTSADNVFIDTASGTGTITCTAGVCANLTVTATQAITLGTTGSTLSVFGNLSIVSGGSFAYSLSLTLTFAATTTGKTIDFGGRTAAAVTFNGLGGGWTLLSAFSAPGNTVTLAAGSLSTAGFSFTASTFIISGFLTRALNLGASTVTIAATWTATTTTGLTFTAGTSTINQTSSGPGPFSGGSLTYNNVAYTSSTLTSANIVGVNIFANLSFASRSSVGISSITLSGNQTVTGTLTVPAPSTLGASRYFFSSSTVGVNRGITAGTVSLTDVDFRDITGNVGTPWTGTRLGNCGGNAGITFDTPKSVYWNLAGTNNWSATGWATTSSGAPATTNFPLAQDTAYFTDNNPAASATITINAVYNLPTIDFTSRTVGITLGQSVGASCYGSFTLSPAVTLSGSGIYTFIARGGTQTITSAGRTWTNPFTINNIGGTVALADACTSSSSSAFIHTQGTVNLAGFTLTCAAYSCTNSNTRTIAFGATGQINCTGTTGTVWNTLTTTGLTITGADPIVVVSSAGGGAIAVSTGTALNVSNRLSFYFTAGTYTLTLSSTSLFNNLNFVGYSGTLANTSRFVYGSMVLSTGMTLAAGTSITYFASTTTQILSSNGKTMDFPVVIDGAAGTLLLADAMTVGSSRSLTLNNGTFDLNGFTATTGSFVTGVGTKNLTFNGGTLAVTAASTTAFNNAAPTGFTTTAGSGTGVISMTAALAKTFVGGGSTYNCTLDQGGAGALSITGGNTFDDITNSVVPATVSFTNLATNTFLNFNLNGTAGNLVTLNSVATGLQATISKASGSVNVNYLSIQDSNATGGATWVASNSTNSGNNTGWSFGGTAFTASQVENFGLSDFTTQAVAFLQSLAENVNANDGSTQTSAFLQTRTENSNIAAIGTIGQLFLTAISEAVSIADLRAISTFYGFTTVENFGLSDTPSLNSVFALSATENVGAGDSAVLIASFTVARAENIGAADTNAVSAAFLQNLTETLTSADAQSVTMAYQGSLTEALTSADIIVGSKGVFLALVENVALAEINTGVAGFAVSRTENVSPLDSSAINSQFFFSKAEAITVQELLEVHGWVTIQDGQTANWQAISDTQTANWTTIADTQTPNWTDIDPNQ